MIYFKNCKNLDEVKTLYKKLAKDNHPDRGGNTATMQAINTEHAYASAHIISDSGLSDVETGEAMRMSEEYRQVIEQIIHLPGILIEVIGHWIWVTGITKPVKDELKAAHFFFASKKVAWYFRTDEYRARRSKMTLDEIRLKYGSETVDPKPKKKGHSLITK